MVISPIYFRISIYRYFCYFNVAEVERIPDVELFNLDLDPGSVLH